MFFSESEIHHMPVSAMKHLSFLAAYKGHSFRLNVMLNLVSLYLTVCCVYFTQTAVTC